MQNDLKIVLYPIQLTLCYTLGEFQIWPKIAQNEKKYDFETLHVVCGNQKNKIWTFKINTLMILTQL